MTAEEAAKIIFDGLKAAGINLIVTLPDINLAQLLREVEEDRDVIHVPLRFAVIRTKVTTERTEVPPYPLDEVENKYRFIRHVEKTEKIEIIETSLPASYG